MHYAGARCSTLVCWCTALVCWCTTLVRWCSDLQKKVDFRERWLRPQLDPGRLGHSFRNLNQFQICTRSRLWFASRGRWIYTQLWITDPGLKHLLYFRKEKEVFILQINNENCYSYVENAKFGSWYYLHRVWRELTFFDWCSFEPHNATDLREQFSFILRWFQEQFSFILCWF